MQECHSIVNLMLFHSLFFQIRVTRVHQRVNTSCTGDCDIVFDCSGELRCAERDRGANVPNCAWSDEDDQAGNNDYCGVKGKGFHIFSNSHHSYVAHIYIMSFFLFVPLKTYDSFQLLRLELLVTLENAVLKITFVKSAKATVTVMRVTKVIWNVLIGVILRQSQAALEIVLV